MEEEGGDQWVHGGVVWIGERGQHLVLHHYNGLVGRAWDSGALGEDPNDEL